MRTALVVGSGAMYGAYGAGVIAELGRQLGPDYFSHVYASSVGVYSATLYVAGQPNLLETIWRGYVGGRNLINFFRIWKILNLAYLENILQNGRSPLDVEAVFKSKTSLKYVLTRHSDGAAVYRSPTPKDIYRCMRASAATFLLHPAVMLDDEWFCDGAFSNPFPIVKALQDGAEFVVAVSNKPPGFRMPISFSAFGIACRVKSRVISRLVHGYENLVSETEEALNDNRRVVVIRPSKPLLLRSTIDTDFARIKATVNLGIEDAREALKYLRH